MATLTFFLGGRDLEMAEIAALVRATVGAHAVVDKGLPWHGAVASAYANEIATALACGRQPVLVELGLDLDAGVIDRCLVVDHHGSRAGADQPTSLEQVFALLHLPPSRWTRRHALVAANDRGWIPGLRAMGATAAEIAAIRAEDRAAQGITAADEEAGARALIGRERVADGSLVVVRLPHARTAVVMDRLAQEAGDDQVPDTLIQSPGEVNFSGCGGRVRALDAAFPGGWCGGALPHFGFWGKAAPLPPVDALIAVLSAA